MKEPKVRTWISPTGFIQAMSESESAIQKAINPFAASSVLKSYRQRYSVKGENDLSVELEGIGDKKGISLFIYIRNAKTDDLESAFSILEKEKRWKMLDDKTEAAEGWKADAAP